MKNSPVAWMLVTGHGTKILEKKPYCQIDYWQGLYLESFVKQQQAEIESLKAELLEWTSEPLVKEK